MNTKLIKINSLDLSYQTRYGLTDETVEEYAQHMSDGKVFPAVTVFDLGDNLALVDGYHRIAAITRIGGDEVKAVVTPGTREDALRASVKANSEHGQRRTNLDKRRALEVAWENRDILFDKMLGQDEDGKPNGLPSSRQLAAITGVSHEFAHHFIEKTMVSTVDTPDGRARCPNATDATAVTSEHLEERNAKVRALLKKSQDRFGMPIPEKILSAFLSTEPKKIRKELKTMRKLCEQRIFGGDIAFVSLGQAFLTKFDNLINDITHWTPHCVCRACRGEGCNRCSNHGFQTKAQYERNPPELKA